MRITWTAIFTLTLLLGASNARADHLDFNCGQGKSHIPCHWEKNNPGDLPGTAEVPYGDGGICKITGTIGNAMEADMYQIFHSGKSLFAASTDSPGTNIDTYLFLFDANGFGVLANDDISTTNHNSSIPPMVLPEGIYYIAISISPWSPYSDGGLIFPDSPRTGVFGPTGPGGSLPVTHWANAGGGGKDDDRGPPVRAMYEIDLVGAEYAATPEPSSLSLFALAAIAAVAYRWRARSPFRNAR